MELTIQDYYEAKNVTVLERKGKQDQRDSVLDRDQGKTHCEGGT